MNKNNIPERKDQGAVKTFWDLFPVFFAKIFIFGKNIEKICITS
jgi:hypothetical protein